jgi:cephalosporin-C deacetylase-like acetyl esterase
MIAGTTIESMQMYEVLRSVELLRTLPEVDPARISVTGKSQAGINALYAALLDGKVEHVILGSPPPSHRQGPHYLGILRYTDIPNIIEMMRPHVRVYGDTAGSSCRSLAACIDALR